MKASVNWMKRYTDINLMPEGIAKLEEKIGAQLGAIEETIDLGARYKGIVVAKVITSVSHPSSDHLHVCTIDDGGVVEDVERDERNFIQIVCGAPNVRENMLVAWLPPGTTVPSSFDKDPLVLESRPIRGEISHGMLASPKELGFSDDHEGILELDKKAKPGDAFADIYELNDYVIDIENKMFTHRPDLFGELGIAREVAGIQHQKFTSPDWYLEPTPIEMPEGAKVLPLVINNRLPKEVPRFMAITMARIEIRPSPIWLQTYLSRVGIRPINNVVDITNYLMMLTAQPLHAYDYDKVLRLDGAVDHATITVRNAQKGEKITLLNGKEIEPRSEAIMIASDKRLIGVGGVMGGSDTEVDERTRNIIIEVASFDMYSIRRTSMEHGLFTDAVTRFNKGQSPLQNDRVMAKAVEMVRELADGVVAGKVLDIRASALTEKGVAVPSADFVNERLGFELSLDEMAELLKNVEFEVVARDKGILVTPPFWRTDIAIPEDVVEEIGRLYAYDLLPQELPTRSVKPVAKNASMEFKQRLRETLARAGANEVLTYSFVHGNLFDKVGQDRAQAFELSNAISPELQYFRLSLTPSLLELIHPNLKAGFDECALFELNKTHTTSHYDEDGLPKEFNTLAMVFASNTAKTPAYYTARRYLDFLADELGIEFSYTPITNAPDFVVSKPFDYGRSALVGVTGTDIMLGIVGEYRSEVRRFLKLPHAAAGFEIGTEELMAAGRGQVYRPLSRFPGVTQDLCLRVNKDMRYAELAAFVTTELENQAPENTAVTVEPLDIFAKEGDSEFKQITFRVAVTSFERTLTSGEINELLEKAAASAHESFGAERV